MSYELTQEYVGILNTDIMELHAKGEPLTMYVNEKPILEIVSFEPLAYKRYGAIINKAPYVAGTLALRGVLTTRHQDGGAKFYAALETQKSQAYGFQMRDLNVLNQIAAVVGKPDLYFSTAFK